MSDSFKLLMDLVRYIFTVPAIHTAGRIMGVEFSSHSSFFTEPQQNTVISDAFQPETSTHPFCGDFLLAAPNILLNVSGLATGSSPAGEAPVRFERNFSVLLC